MPDPATLGKCNFTRGRSPPPQQPPPLPLEEKKEKKKKKKKKKKMKGERRERDEEAQRRIRGPCAAPTRKEQHIARHDQKEQTRATGRPARAPRETGPLLQVRLHTRHRSGLVSGQEKQERAAAQHVPHSDRGRRRPAAARDNKPAVILDYNSNKGGVDNLDKVVATYSCRRMTARWPLAVFHNILDVSSYNAFVIWRELNPDWLPGKRNKRRVFLEQLGKALVAPLIERRTRLPRAEAAAAVVKTHRLAAGGGGGGGGGGCSGSGGVTATPALPPPPPPPPPPSAAAATSTAPVNPPLPASKRKRCQVCPSKKDCKTHNVCRGCEKYICRGCALLYCPACANYFCSSSERGSV
ncbi:hypothetical protein D5F01_LYC24208 [Larimichthys crocea]|uniref:PiggyBac transposable element-derived protein domain-containing protein n=1 Tax=Larimichthys crocea TaxID=215358 RepID=A0A6G0HEZ8_LARCR|nr:hypothetical protein D5F01_LYC24208 [Larimichthys crocea]